MECRNIPFYGFVKANQNFCNKALLYIDDGTRGHMCVCMCEYLPLSDLFMFILELSSRFHLTVGVGLKMENIKYFDWVDW